MREPSTMRMFKLWGCAYPRTRSGQKRVLVWALLYIKHCRRRRWSHR